MTQKKSTYFLFYFLFFFLFSVFSESCAWGGASGPSLGALPLQGQLSASLGQPEVPYKEGGRRSTQNQSKENSFSPFSVDTSGARGEKRTLFLHFRPPENKSKGHSELPALH